MIGWEQKIEWLLEEMKDENFVNTFIKVLECIEMIDELGKNGYKLQIIPVTSEDEHGNQLVMYEVKGDRCDRFVCKAIGNRLVDVLTSVSQEILE